VSATQKHGGKEKPTNVSLPKIVRLTGSRVGTGKFPVDFILDVTHRDESDNNTTPTPCLH